MFHRLSKGFTIVEMVTALGIAGVIGVTGLNSYQKQRQQARAAQAQYSLSNIYTAEKNFHTQWGTYHENLYIIGAIPEGELWYDAGFSTDSNPSNTDGDLQNYPWQNRLTLTHCNTHDQICRLLCADEVGKGVTLPAGKTARQEYGGFTCNVVGGALIKGNVSGYDAKENEFKAVAIGKLKSKDEWSINQKQEVKHETDGTGN